MRILLYKKNLSLFIVMFYVFFNIYNALYFIYDGGKLGGDFVGENRYTTPETLLISSFLIVITFLATYFFVAVILSIKIKARIKVVKSKIVDLIFLFITLVYLYGIYTGQYIMIDKSVNMNSSFLLSIFNFVFVPSFILLIYLFYRAEDRGFIYYLILTLYLMSSFLKGETYILILMLPLIYIIRKGIKPVKLYTMVIMAIIVYPFIRMLKGYLIFKAVSMNKSEDIMLWVNANNNSDNFFGFYMFYFQQGVERFQHVANVAYLYDHLKDFIMYLSNNDYSIIASTITVHLKNMLFSYSTGTNMNVIFNYFHSGFTLGSEHIGLAGYILIYGWYSIILFVFLMIIIFFSLVLSKWIDKTEKVTILTFYLIFILVCHSWFNAFILYINALIVFSVIMLLLRFYLRSRDEYETSTIC